jgi:hypothetical protein
MAFECKKGHVHSTQLAADSCFICKRRAQKKSSKAAKREQQSELSELLREKNRKTLSLALDQYDMFNSQGD